MPEQIILIVNRPITGEAEAFPQPQHRFEPGDRPARRFKGLEAADLGHVLLHSEVVALDALAQMLGNIMDRVWMQKPIINGRLDR